MSAFDSDPNLIINTGTGDDIGATIGTDFVNNQHLQLFKVGFGDSTEFTRVGDGADVNSSPLPMRLYQSGSGTSITSTPFSGNHALDVNVRGLSGAGNIKVDLQTGVTGTDALQIQGASGGYAIAITTDAPLPISGSLTATLSGSTVGVTNSDAAALFVQPATGVTFNVAGNLSASVDNISGGTLSISGFTGMTPLVVTGDVNATLSGGSTFGISGFASGVTLGVTLGQNLDIRGLTTERDSVKVMGYGAGDSVKTVLGWNNGGLFTSLGVCSDNNSLNVNIAGLSSLSVTADISSLSDLTINNEKTNAVPIQGATVDATPVFISGTAGSAYPIGITSETPLVVDVVTMPSIAGSVDINIAGMTLFGGTIDTILSAGVTNTNASALYIQPKAGMTFGVTGDVGVHVGGIVSGVTIGIGGNGLGSGVTVGITTGVGGLDVRGLTTEKDSVVVYGSGVTAQSVGQPVFLMGISAGGNEEVPGDGTFEHLGSSGGHLLTHVVNPLTLSGDLTISNTTLGISSIAEGSVVGVTNDNEQALYIQLKKGATLASSVTGDVTIGHGGITFDNHSIEVVGGGNTLKTDGRPVGTVLMGFTAGVTTDLGEGVYQGVVDAVGATLESMRSSVASESTLSSISQNVTDIENLITSGGVSLVQSLRNLFVQVVASQDDSIETASQVNTNINSITLPDTGFVKTYALTSGDSAPTLPSFLCKRGVRIKCESGTSDGGMRVGFVSPATNSNADTTTTLGFNLLVGEEIFLEIDNLNKIEVAKCGDLLNFTVIST